MTKDKILSILHKDTTDEEKAEEILCMLKLQGIERHDEDRIFTTLGDISYASGVASIVGYMKGLHTHLHGCGIYCAFRDNGELENGRSVYAMISRPPASRPDLYNYDFVLLATKPLWESLTLKQQKAIIDHELSHIKFDETSATYYMVGHDIGEFYNVIERYGAFNDELERLRIALNRL